MPRSNQQQITEIRDDLAALHEDIASLTETIKEVVGANDDAPALTEKVQEGLQSSVEWARDMGSQTQKYAQTGVKAARKQMKERPMASLAMAVGLGVLCGQLLGRK